MKRRTCQPHTVLILGALLIAATPGRLAAEPPPAANAAFDAYAATVESSLAQQHRLAATFLASAPQNEARLRRGELVIERLTPPAIPALSGAMLHHWRGAAFAPGATAADFERLMKNFAGYPRIFAPQVLQARVLTQQGDRLQASMRVRQRHLLTVVMDTTYDITYARLDQQHGSSLSRATRIAEIDAPGTPTERPLPSSDDHGFLWRLNTYWTYEERDGGLYMQVESISLTRAIPRGLGWAVGPYVESVPRESLEFTLRSTCNALRR